MIAIVGGSASGKSTVAGELMKVYGFKKIVSYTTRDIREGEVDGVDYHFISEEEFRKLYSQNFFAETGCYRGWKYGTPANECADDKVIVVTPHGLRQLKTRMDLDITSFYIKVNQRDRLIKALQRNDNIDECYRRSTSDCGMFDGLEDEVDFVIENDGYDKSPLEIASMIVCLMGIKEE